MAEESRIVHRIGILEMPNQRSLLQRMLEVVHGPERAQVFLSAVAGSRFVVMCHPDPLGAGLFSTNALDDVLTFLGELWRRARLEDGEFHYVVNASPEVEARVDRFARELAAVFPRAVSGGGL